VTVRGSRIARLEDCMLTLRRLQSCDPSVFLYRSPPTVPVTLPKRVTSRSSSARRSSRTRRVLTASKTGVTTLSRPECAAYSETAASMCIVVNLRA
jgi:hypothetical protein